MRKFILLLSFVVFASISSSAQMDTVFIETFDTIYNGPDSVTNYSIGAPPNASMWKDTSNLYRTPYASYHTKLGRAIPAPLLTEITFETDPFSTIGKPYVFLTFKHICKIYILNRGRIEISVDAGTTWVDIDKAYYKGSDIGPGLSQYSNLSYFNEGSYQGQGDLWQQSATTAGNSLTPTNSWWATEKFDLSGLASNLVTNTGYPDVRLRFTAEVRFALPTGPPSNPLYPPNSYLAGWWVDDIVVTASPCELEPPKIDFNYTPIPICYPNQPENGLVANQTPNYKVGAKVTDVGGHNTGVDSVSIYYSINEVMPFSHLKMANIGGTEYEATIPGVNLGDTVRWYLVAEDIGCPLISLNNSARSPDLFYVTNTQLDPSTYTGFYTFWIDSALPAKCGAPDCGAYPLLIQTFPYVIDFEGPEWGQSGTGWIRGVPTDAPYYWENRAPAAQPGFGWTINSGTTPSSPYTGPLGDHTTGNGKYAYLEVSPSGSSSHLNTPCINLRSNANCLGLEFYYHMYGNNTGTLKLEIDTGNNQFDWHKNYKIVNGEQQTNQGDPWQRGIISLDPFKSEIIRIRFNGLKGNGANGDIAIDDIRIYEPDPIDMITLSNNLPKDGFCDYSSQPVKMTVINNGCETIDTIPVAYNINGGTAVWDTIYQTLMLGDTVTHVFSQNASFPTFGSYQIATWTGAVGDVDNSNDTAKGPAINYVASINTFPYFENFENGIPNTQNIGNNNWIFTNGVLPNFRLQVNKDDFTPTRNSGPASGYHYEGQYLYAESNNTTGSAETFMRSLCFDFAGMTNPVFEYFYHGYGSNFSKVEIQVSEEDEDLDTWTTVSTLTNGNAPQNSELDRWEMHRVNLTAYAGQSLKIRFKVFRSGAGNATNFAIDNIRVYDRITNDAGAYSIDKPTYRSAGVGLKTNGTVSIVNLGTATLNTCTVNVKITPLCGPNQGQSTVYSQYASGLALAPGNVASVQFTSGITYPQGEFEFMAYTSNVNGTNSTTGDTHRFNDTIKRNIIATTTIPIPFSNNFDPCNYEIYGTYPDVPPASQGVGLLQWELGTPSSGNILNARSSPNAWVTNLDGPYLVNTREPLFMPIFDEFDTVFRAELRFYQNIDFGNSTANTTFNSAGTVLYNTGGNWEVLGNSLQGANIGINWHGTCLGTPSSAFFNNQPAFVISTTPTPSCVKTGAANGWIYTMFPLNEWDGDSLSVLRTKFEFASNSSMSQSSAKGGWGIDDYEIYIPPQNSASPTKVRTESPLPFPGFDQTLEITVQNTGGKLLKSFYVDVYIGGIGGTKLNTTPYRHVPANGPVLSGYSTTFDFPVKWPAALVTSGAHEVCVVTYLPNDKPDNLPSDDTLCSILSVIKEVDVTANGDFDFCDDFEDPTDYAWITLNTSDYGTNTSWEEGAPVQFTGGAHSGNNVWMTGLSTDYIDGDESSLFTPVFIVDSGVPYNIHFWHQMKTEKYHDGGNIEYSLDGGVSWYTVGWSLPNQPNWYNTPFVTALDQIRSGWTDTINGWQEATQTIAFKKSTKAVFRFRFGADYDIIDAGWAIDDFCFSKDTTGGRIEYTIGVDENKLPNTVVFGTMAPNPAKGSSTLEFFVPERQEIKVKVFNVLGQEVESFENTYQEGLNKMTFDTQKWKGGLYFINLEYNGEAITRKLIIAN